MSQSTKRRVPWLLLCLIIGIVLAFWLWEPEQPHQHAKRAVKQVKEQEARQNEERKDLDVQVRERLVTHGRKTEPIDADDVVRSLLGLVERQRQRDGEIESSSRPQGVAHP